MAFLDVALASAAVVSVGATAYGLSGANQPQEPNLASSSSEISNAEASMLPAYRQLAAEAQLGENSGQLKTGYQQQDASAYRAQLSSQITALQRQLQASQGEHGHEQQATQISAQISRLQNDLAGAPTTGTVYTDSQGNAVPASQATSGANFTGYGTADIQGRIAEQMAPGELALAQKYDPQFIAAALAQENLANPQGAQARQAENALIQKQITQPIANPVAQTLTDQVQSQVEAGKGLDEFDKQALDQAVQQALQSRGATNQGQNWQDGLTAGAAGTARQMAGIQKGVGLMTSGVTPQDVAYRREQQNLANLSREISGQTPVTEFRSLSGAQEGPTPTVAGQALPLAGQNQLPTAAGAYETQYAQQINQPNPWLTGITSAINAGTAASNLGWQPLAPAAG